jgi:hypothetical protein
VPDYVALHVPAPQLHKAVGKVSTADTEASHLRAEVEALKKEVGAYDHLVYLTSVHAVKHISESWDGRSIAGTLNLTYGVYIMSLTHNDSCDMPCATGPGS